jgi:hypothetical protein
MCNWHIITIFGELARANSRGDHSSSYPSHFFTYKEGNIEVDKTTIRTKVQDKQIIT